MRDWSIFIAIWVAAGFGLHHANPDLPAQVWILIYGIGCSFSAIAFSMWREGAHG